MKTKTMRELAQEALDAQSATSLLGVLRSFEQAMDDLFELLNKEPGGVSFSVLNTHHICILFARKVASLSGANSDARCSDAYQWALQQVK